VKSDDVPTLDVEPRLLREWPLPQPDGGADKEARGSTLVIAGSAEMPGAACLAATSALRAGAGKMAVATVAGIAPGVALLLAEARVLALAQTDAGGIGAEAMSQIESRLAKVDAVLIGPGLLDFGVDGSAALPLACDLGQELRRAGHHVAVLLRALGRERGGHGRVLIRIAEVDGEDARVPAFALQAFGELRRLPGRLRPVRQHAHGLLEVPRAQRAQAAPGVQRELRRAPGRRHRDQ